MSGLIEEIQRDASDDSIAVSQLLRRMKIAASKLKLAQLGQWVELELNGYPDEVKVPDYRTLGGVPVSFNRFHGWQLISLGPNETANFMCSTLFFRASIAEVEAHAVESGSLTLSFPEFLERALIQQRPSWDKVGLSVGRGKFNAILNGVRNRALDWALAVEEAGVTGEGMSFTASERAAATVVTNNIYGNNARINQQSTDNSANSVA